MAPKGSFKTIGTIVKAVVLVIFPYHIAAWRFVAEIVNIAYLGASLVLYKGDSILKSSFRYGVLTFRICLQRLFHFYESLVRKSEVIPDLEYGLCKCRNNTEYSTPALCRIDTSPKSSRVNRVAKISNRVSTPLPTLNNQRTLKR